VQEPFDNPDPFSQIPPAIIPPYACPPGKIIPDNSSFSPFLLTVRVPEEPIKKLLRLITSADVIPVRVRRHSHIFVVGSDNRPARQPIFFWLSYSAGQVSTHQGISGIPLKKKDYPQVISCRLIRPAQHFSSHRRISAVSAPPQSSMQRLQVSNCGVVTSWQVSLALLQYAYSRHLSPSW